MAAKVRKGLLFLTAFSLLSRRTITNFAYVRQAVTIVDRLFSGQNGMEVRCCPTYKATFHSSIYFFIVFSDNV